LNIEIVGINYYTDSSFNPSITSGNSIPWLQDTLSVGAWTRWGAAKDDLRIVDSLNRPWTNYSLIQHDLTLAENREALKQLFLAPAKVVDADRDGLPDDWEYHYFGSLAADRHGDPDGDGFDNLAEFAFGTDPNVASSPLRASLVSVGSQSFLAVTFRRRAGAFVDYVVEASPSLLEWNVTPVPVVALRAPRNLFDGTGTLEAAYRLTEPFAGQATRFLRVRAVLRRP
jgi:hypothetical protein